MKRALIICLALLSAWSTAGAGGRTVSTVKRVTDLDNCPAGQVCVDPSGNAKISGSATIGTADHKIARVSDDIVFYDPNHPAGLTLGDLLAGAAGVDWSSDQSPTTIHINNIPDLSSIYQPLDADLAAVAALTTNAYGLALLELTNQAGLMALLDLSGKQDVDADLTTAAGADSAGNSKYFGTNAGGTPGFYDLPAGGGDDLGSATYSDVVALWASGSCSGYLKSDGTCDTPAAAFDPAEPGEIGGTTPAAATFTTVTAASFATSASDGSRYSTLANNTTGNQPASASVVTGLYSYEQAIYFVENSGTAVALSALFRTADIDDTPVDSETSAPISSNWAYDHINASNPHSITADLLGFGTDDTPQLTGLEIGHASDTTLARLAAGVATIEGRYIPTSAQAQRIYVSDSCAGETGMSTGDLCFEY